MITGIRISAADAIMFLTDTGVPPAENLFIFSDDNFFVFSDDNNFIF